MKPLFSGLAVALVIVSGGFFLLRDPDDAALTETESNAAVIDGVQVVTIRAKGGYRPGTSAVKAGMPTVLRFETDGTFDCSSVISVPSLGIAKTLPPSGTTDVSVGILQPGKLQGTCGMGMYRFAVEAR